MFMFIGSLGLQEIILILVLALLLFGPKKLPEIGRSLGRGLREFKKGTTDLVDNLNEEIKRPVESNQPKEQPKPVAAAPVAARATAGETQSDPAPASETSAKPEPMVINLEEEDSTKS